MKNFIFFGILLGALTLSSCSSSIIKSPDKNLSVDKVPSLTGDKPPNVIVEIDGEKYETILGTYCWEVISEIVSQTTCNDTVGSVDLLKDKEPIQIEGGAQVKLIMDYTPRPNKIHLTQINNDKRMEIEVNDNQFAAPDEKGIYFYEYGVWWMDEKDKNISHGDASYAFVLEVK